MKSLFVTLVILAAAFLGYDYYLAAPWERLVFERGPKPVPTLAPSREVEDASPVAPMTAKAPAVEYVPAIPVVPSKEFVPPQVASLEELTKNWTAIPAHAFPREIKLRKAVDVKMAVGSARLPEGATAYAHSVDNGLIAVAPTQTSPARGTVAVMDSDLPDQLRQSYEKWKTARIESARQAWLGKKTAKTINNVTVNSPVDLTGALDPAGKPMQAKDGTYPLLVASMQAAEVTDITLARIRRWGHPIAKLIGGQPTWTVDVWYQTMAFCGPMEAQAQAQVRNGKVIAWIYPGSGEPVP
ncbi:MAG: hypothetical protein U0984_10655 [Prosthecobacter sp.]|nr:hypothetical protein [Prosthecobacter sp.]